MCGICGIVTTGGDAIESRIRRMMEKIKHRGPDDEGTFVEDQIGMGFLRLSVIDLSPAGHQPMFDHQKRYVITFNGEIFNYIELREQLGNEYPFKSKTDTEVILAAYLKWGEECLHQFNGMFAFTIYDRHTKKLFGARDRFGVKPFYYQERSGSFEYASEIPALLALNDKKPNVNERVMFDYLAYNRTDQNNETFFENIFQLPHGHCFVYTKGKLTIKRWYHLPPPGNERPIPPQEMLDLLIDSVKLRMRSDVPVGVCLSGGLDSSAITAICSRHLKKKDLQTFSAVYGAGVAGDESKYIELLRQDVKTLHMVKPDLNGFLSDIKRFVRAQAEPVPSVSPYAQFKVMEQASKSVVVTLDGQGADEALAGYHYFFGFYYRELLNRFRWIELIKEIISYFSVHRSFYAIKTFFYFLLPEALKQKALNNGKKSLRKSFINHFSGQNLVTGNLYASRNLYEACRNHFEFKLEHLLKWSDRNSMYFSVESRAPFLDYRLVELCFQTDSKSKIHKGTTKYLLRESLKDTLPEEIRTRKDKVGFETPATEWFRSKEGKAYVFDIINSESFKKRPYFEHSKVCRLFDLHLKRKKNLEKEIWKWINVELWMREFVD